MSRRRLRTSQTDSLTRALGWYRPLFAAESRPCGLCRLFGSRKPCVWSRGGSGGSILPVGIHLQEATPMYLVDYLRSHRVWFKTLLHPPASSAAKLASSLHVPGRAVAKTVLVNAGGGYVLTVLAATSRIELNRLCLALRLEPGRRLATAEEVARMFRTASRGRSRRSAGSTASRRSSTPASPISPRSSSERTHATRAYGCGSPTIWPSRLPNGRASPIRSRFLRPP